MATDNKLIAKVIIGGTIEVITGLHIGGSKATLDIGGVDLNVIKMPSKDKQPYIPGSSLKGKLRSLLAKTHGFKSVEQDSGIVTELFGMMGQDNGGEITSLLIFRDARLTNGGELQKWDMDYDYTEVKTENTIDRLTGTAKHPRQQERVPAGAKFSFEVVYDLWGNDGDKVDDSNPTYTRHYNELIKAFNLLNDDYLGGSGTRGYGKVKVDTDQLNVVFKGIQSHYSQR